MNKYSGLLLWLILNILVVILMDVALFYQGTPAIEKCLFYKNY